MSQDADLDEKLVADRQVDYHESILEDNARPEINLQSWEPWHDWVERCISVSREIPKKHDCLLS